MVCVSAEGGGSMWSATTVTGDHQAQYLALCWDHPFLLHLNLPVPPCHLHV